MDVYFEISKSSIIINTARVTWSEHTSVGVHAISVTTPTVNNCASCTENYYIRQCSAARDGWVWHWAVRVDGLGYVFALSSTGCIHLLPVSGSNQTTVMPAMPCLGPLSRPSCRPWPAVPGPNTDATFGFCCGVRAGCVVCCVHPPVPASLRIGVHSPCRLILHVHGCSECSPVVLLSWRCHPCLFTPGRRSVMADACPGQAQCPTFSFPFFQLVQWYVQR